MRATVPHSSIRSGKRRLLSSCAVAAGIVALSYGGPARAQVAGSALNPPGGVTISTDMVAHSTTVDVTDTQTIIDWRPTDLTGTGDINFLPTGNTWNFNYGGTAGDFVVLNRFVDNVGGSLSRQIALNGEINSYVGLTSGTQGGSIWFYNAGGILIGNTGAINVGSLVLTTNDIQTSGGFFGTDGQIQFRAATNGSTAGVTVNGAIHANQSSVPGSSYVALVAPRITQAGVVDVYGSAAYVAAESADVTINAGLFTINVLSGAAGGQAITHTGVTTGPEQQATGPAQRIYMVAIPKNDAVTMLVSGRVGYQASATTARTDSDGRVVLAAGYDVTIGDIDIPPNATASAPADLIVRDIILHSDVTAHASGAFVGQPLQDIPPPPPPSSVPLPNPAGALVVQGDATFAGDTSATLTIDTGHVGRIEGNLIVQSGGTFDTPGNALIDVDGGRLGVQGNTSISAPAFSWAETDTQGGNAALTVANGGQMTVSGDLDLSADANGGSDDGGMAIGNGIGGTVGIGVAGAGSSLTGSTIYLHANGNGALPSSGSGVADIGASGTGGDLTVRVQDGGSLSATTALTLAANGQGRIGLNQSGIGRGGNTLIEVTGAGSSLQAVRTNLIATGIGGGGSIDDPSTGPVTSLNGGDGIGGTATLRFNATGTSPRSTGDTFIDISAEGGSAGSFVAASGENADGGDATGRAATIEVLNGNTQMTALQIDASALSGDARSGSGTTARSGNAQGGTISVSAIGTGSALSLSSGSIILEAGGTASTGIHENAGNGHGGVIGVSARNGGTISGVAILAGSAFGGSENISSLIGAGTGTGGSVDFLADTGGTLSAQSYQARANAGVVNTDGNNGAAQGGDVSMIARSGGSIIATVSGVSVLEAHAIDGVSADGSTATGGGVQMIADGGTLRLRSVALDASATSGSDNADIASLATGGPIAIQVSADADSLMSFDTLDAQANGVAGANFDGFVPTPGDARGGTITFDMQGGSLSTSTITTSITLSANGNGGSGGEGRGGSVSFTQTGGDVTTGNMLITADGQGGEAGDGIGNLATLSLAGGTFTGSAVVVTATGNGGHGLFGNDDPDFGRDGGTGGLGRGGTATIDIDGTATVHTALLGAYASGTGGSGGDFFTDGLEAGAGGAGGTGAGGFATINLVAGELISDIVTAEARGNGGTGGTIYPSSSGGPTIGGGVGGNGGQAFGGIATLNLGETVLPLGTGTLSGRAIATGGRGGDGPDAGSGGNGGDAVGGTAQAIVDNHDAGVLALTLNSTATGGDGGTGDSGTNAGSGGFGQGGISRVEADGAGAAAVISQTSFQTGGTGGAGGSAFTDFFATPQVGGRGGDGGDGYGGAIEVVADNGAAITLGDASGGGVIFGSTGTGGAGGNGADNPNTISVPAPDGMGDIIQGLTGGDGGTGGGGIGGTVHLLANNGGSIDSNGAPLTITVGGVSGNGGNGGNGSGGNGSAGSTVADQGGLAVLEAWVDADGVGQINLGDTVIQANGGVAGRIELRTDGRIAMNSLAAEAFGYADPTFNDTDVAGQGIFFAPIGGSIVTNGDMTLRTDGSFGAYAQADGIVSAGGNMRIETGDQVDLRHEYRGDAANPTLLAAGDLSLLTVGGISGAADTLVAAGGTLTLQATNVNANIGVDRIAGNDIVITGPGRTDVEHAEAVDDFTANVGRFRTGLNSIITHGDIDITAVGTVDLGNSTAGGHISVEGQSIAFNNADAGTFVSLRALGAGAADGVFGTGIAADGGVSLNGRSIGINGTVQSGESLFVTANAGDAAIGLADVAGNISVFAGTDLSGTYRADGNVNLGAGGNVTAEADAAGGYVDPSGGFTFEGYVFVDAGGDVSLTNSSAATMLGVRAGGAASLTGASAGEDVFVLAGTTATLSGITADDDLTVQASGAIGVTNATTTGTGRDDRSIIYAPGSSSSISFLQIVTTTPDLSNVTLTAGAGIAAANIDAFNNLTATANGSIAATGPLVAGGNILASAAGAVNLANANAAGFIDVDGTSIAFGALDAGGYVDLDTTGSSGDPGAITGTSIIAGSDVYMAGGSIGTGSITGAASLSAIGTAGAVAIDNAVITGNIGISAAGNISGTYGAGGDALLSSGNNVVASVSAAGGYPDSSNPDLPSGGNVYVDAAGNVTLTDSSAAGMFGVNGRSVALTNAEAGEDMLVLAQGTATLSEISVGDDLDVRATGAITATGVSATGLGPDGFQLAYSPTGGFTIGQGEGSTSLDGADIDLRSSGAAIDANGLSAGDDIFLTAATTIALNDATTLGLGITGGDSSIRTSGGATTLSGLDAFSDVIVDATGTANLTGAVAAGRDVLITASDVMLADVVSGTTLLDTITAGRNVAITSATDITGGVIDAGGSLTLAADGSIAIGNAETGDGGDMTLSAGGGINASQLYSRGVTTLTAADGDIGVGTLSSSGTVSVSANSLNIGTNGPIEFADIVTNSGDATIQSNNRLIVDNATIAGTARFNNSGEHMIIRALTADGVDFNANEMITMTDVAATNGLFATAGTTIAIDGVVTGHDIALTSGDIDIAATGRVGTADVTQALSVRNGNDQQQTFVGGTGTRNGYHIDADELTRLFGSSVEIFAPAIETNNSAVASAPTGGIAPDRIAAIGGPALPDVVVDGFTMTGGASGSNLGANGSLTIRTPGKIRFVGEAQLTGLSDTNAFNLQAGDAIEVILGQGTVRLLGAGDAPGGQFNTRSRDIVVATTAAIDDVAAAATTDAIETRLAQNDGIVLDEGALFARSISFEVTRGVYVQNSGSGTDYAQRRGLTFGAGGLNVATEGNNARIVLNGVHLGANGQVTGLDAIPLLTVNGRPVAVPSDLYDPRSTFNGCLIANVAACSFVPPPQPEYESNFPVQDVIEKEVDSDDESGDGTTLPTALITMRDLDPLTGEPLLDDPVTGAGNDDLWTPTTDTQP